MSPWLKLRHSKLLRSASVAFVKSGTSKKTKFTDATISFDEAKTVFTGQFARLIADPEHSEEEDRFILLGTSIHSRLLVVCHCDKLNETIRIISARKADKQERMIYEGFHHA